MKWLWLLIPILVWLAGDALYALAVAWRHRRWERRIQREPGGVRTGCQPFETGTGETALLLVHGFNDSPVVFQAFARRLAGLGYFCRAIRLPGFAVPISQTREVVYQAWQATLAAEVQALRLKYKRVVLVGHSLGGAVSLSQALVYPNSIAALVLLAPAVEVSNRRSPLLPVRKWLTLAEYTLPFSRLLWTPFLVDAQSAEAKNYPWLTPYVTRRICRELFNLLAENQQRPAVLHVPLLMFLARHEHIISNNAADRFFDKVEAPCKERIVLEESGHAIPIDSNWEEAADQTAAFLKNRMESELPK